MNDHLLEAKLVAEGDCLVYSGRRDRDGYGEVRRNGKSWKAHRLAWTSEHGEIPEGMKVLHSCDNPPCCKLSHLSLGTQGDNVSDMAKKDRHGNQKITMVQAEEIRRLVSEGPRGTAAQLAREHGVHPSCITKIAKGLQRV